MGILRGQRRTGARAGPAPGRISRRRLDGAAPWLAAVATVLAIEATVHALRVPAYVFPAPSAVLLELARDRSLLLGHAAVTLAEAGFGLVLAAAAALLFAAAAVHSRLLDRVLSPLVVISQTIPVIALAPLLVLWFGYGATPRVIVCALVAFFPMAVTALQGLSTVDTELLLLLRSVDASPWDVFWQVRVPYAAPHLAAGLRTGATLSLVGAVVAEWTGSDSGLGYLVLSANARLATSQAFAAVVLITALGLLAYSGSHLVEDRVAWWRRQSLSSDTPQGV